LRVATWGNVSADDVPSFSLANPKFQLANRGWRQVQVWLGSVIEPKLLHLFPKDVD